MSEPNENALNPQPENHYLQPAPAAVPKLPPLAADRRDGYFAIFAFVLGYLFSRWVLGTVQGWGTAVFTTVYLASVLAYLLVKDVRLPKSSWFWFAVTLLTGWSFAFWDNTGLMPLRNLFLSCAAVYWVAAATNVQIGGKTGNLLLLDGINSVLLIPFRNFANQYRALGALRGKRERDLKKALPVLLGIILALLVLLVVTPQLLRADSGGFNNLLKDVTGLFKFDTSKVLEFLFYCLLAVPTAAYLFGLVSGSAARRATDTIKADKTAKAVAALRILAPVTIYTVLGTACALYVLFIACQVPYFFSAFSGVRPDGWLSYSDYARQGFFELCRLSAINLAMLLAANILSKKPREESAVLKVFNIALSLITLLLIATAMSKMALYIGAFGLTILRILPCVFMLLLAVVCVAVVLLQRMRFSIARVSLAAGAVLFAALCLVNVDGIIVRYNTERYLAGTLATYDSAILYRSGPAGVRPALEVYETTKDAALKNEIESYLVFEKEKTTAYRGTFRHTVEKERTWEALQDIKLPHYGEPREAGI
ncbi:protein of unknown function [Sporobacter termitidis DSM 10068]|uniref:Uncharacterized protein n=1 Tax=Sporobacter termitidis DSM 10068 TaxID=1123282 RepID=A0A1M5VJE7_9FIRM|nr:DUF4173 domain-containing protein [Sporobacter termitidis]SHH75325.1 protein of unknown function [Sporobacter termitidis DSM 10068]